MYCCLCHALFTIYILHTGDQEFKVLINETFICIFVWKESSFMMFNYIMSDKLLCEIQWCINFLHNVLMKKAHNGITLF